ncbi:unnamed protein product [Gongylonema pulchrum]|uniref:Uncharacterized protein n=1 Tax=Gongylonema pulchrum TaxID=637853 RepID=A0A183EM78_9BILA|nr:unnamed protein product [Gongylonema pulchrum]
MFENWACVWQNTTIISVSEPLSTLMAKFRNPFGDPFATTDVVEESWEAASEPTYVPSAFCQLIDDMIGKRTRPWDVERKPIRPFQVEFMKFLLKYIAQTVFQLHPFCLFDISNEI